MYTITQTLIKTMFDRGTELEYCPSKVYYCELTRQLEIIESESMLKGKYMETGMIGRSVKGSKTTDLPRKRETKELQALNVERARQGLSLFRAPKRTIHNRLDAQIEIFKAKQQYHGFELNSHNTQVELKHRLNEDFMLQGTLDIFPVILKRKNDNVLSIIDLKYTQDIRSTWGKYCYGDPKNLDSIQGMMYMDLATHLKENMHVAEAFTPEMLDLLHAQAGKVHFYMWVFDGKLDYESKAIEVVWTLDKERQYRETLRKCISEVERQDQMGWNENPKYEFCHNCPLNPINGINKLGKSCEYAEEIEKT